MPGGDSAPNAVNPNEYLFGSGGQEINMFGRKMKVGGRQGLMDKALYDRFQKMFTSPEGISQETRDIFEKQGIGKLTGNLMQSESDLGGSLNAAGNIPLMERVKAFSGLRKNYDQGVSDVYSNIAGQNENAKMSNKQMGLSSIFNTLGLGQQGAGQESAYNMNRYQIDEANRFKFGDMLGSLLGAGGQIGGAYAGRPGKK